MEQDAQYSATLAEIPPIIARAIFMVQKGFDDSGPNPGYQRQILWLRLGNLQKGWAEIRQKAPQLVPPAVDREIMEIEAALYADVLKKNALN